MRQVVIIETDREQLHVPGCNGLIAVVMSKDLEDVLYKIAHKYMISDKAMWERRMGLRLSITPVNIPNTCYERILDVIPEGRLGGEKELKQNISDHVTDYTIGQAHVAWTRNDMLSLYTSVESSQVTKINYTPRTELTSLEKRLIMFNRMDRENILKNIIEVLRAEANE